MRKKKDFEVEIWAPVFGIVLYFIFAGVPMLPPEGSVQTLTFQQAPHKWIANILGLTLFIAGVVALILEKVRASRR